MPRGDGSKENTGDMAWGQLPETQPPPLRKSQTDDQLFVLALASASRDEMAAEVLQLRRCCRKLARESSELRQRAEKAEAGLEAAKADVWQLTGKVS